MLLVYFLCFLGWLVFEGLTILVTNYWMDRPNSPKTKRLRRQLTVLWLLLAGLVFAGFYPFEPCGTLGD